MQIIAIRHPSTIFNERELINGTIDEGLSTKGLEQIDEAISLLQDYDFDAVYCSPLKRSKQTASKIARHYKLPLEQDSRITEVDLGSFNGQSWQATVTDFGLDSSKLLSSGVYDFRSYGGESARQVENRLRSFLADLKKQPEQKPLLVTHGGTLRCLHYICTGQKTGRIPNLTVFVFST